jgi:prevent-host-death family protein
MTTINAEQLATELIRVLDAVVAGEEVLITREGAPVAKLTDVRPPIRAGFGGAAGSVRVHENFDSPLPDFENCSPGES